jgi:copper chaperone NosL
MGVADLRFGGEVITKKGKIYKFDDMRCMIDFLKSGTLEEKDIAKKLFMNFEKPNEFLNVNTAWFAASKETRSPMNSNISGFESKAAAENILKDKTGELASWDEIYQRVK